MRNPTVQRRNFCIASRDLTIQCLKSGIPLGNLLPGLCQVGHRTTISNIESDGISNRQKNDHLFHFRPASLFCAITADYRIDRRVVFSNPLVLPFIVSVAP
ncbi:hypothetical protein [Novacetimonas hansenii]|uniref:Uncharacterized protein n=1 Tax=Novacetimonas hansenii TaxID=436 RepID=A0AAW5EXR7_NOVHA|nr:hypothetical protein [Novacetimonas hansenii]MCJ8355324.1 hypothetical protein [Novacetimonas hansenii]